MAHPAGESESDVVRLDFDRPSCILASKWYAWTGASSTPSSKRSVAVENSDSTAIPTNSQRGRRTRKKFTPEAIEKIKKLRKEGARREDIADSLGVSVNSLSVTCSRLGISLRSEHHTADQDARTEPAPDGIAQAREHKEALQAAVDTVPSGKFSLIIRCGDKEVVTDIPFTPHQLAAVAVNTALRDARLTKLLGQLLVSAIKKDMVQQILGEKSPRTKH